MISTRQKENSNENESQTFLPCSPWSTMDVCSQEGENFPFYFLFSTKLYYTYIFLFNNPKILY